MICCGDIGEKTSSCSMMGTTTFTMSKKEKEETEVI